MQLDDQFLPDSWRQEISKLSRPATEALAAVRSGGKSGGQGLGPWLGWYDYPRLRGTEAIEDIKSRLGQIDVFYNLIVVVGIGGSYLGTRAVHDALAHTYALNLSDERSSRQTELPIVFAGESLSEVSLLETLDLLERVQPLMVVVSKSGTTTEPAVAFRVLRSYFAKRFGAEGAAQRTVVVTDPKSGCLRSMAEESRYLAFEIPQDVGGRFSVMTPVGLVPLALARWSIEALVAGADSFFTEIRDQNPESLAGHPVLGYATARFYAYQQGKKIEVLAYSEPKLRFFGEWWKQLFGESEGKDGKGIFPAAVQYTTDLHSLGQYMQGGERHILETFISFGRAGLRSDLGIERSLSIPKTADDRDQLQYLAGRSLTEINELTMDATRIAHFDGQVPCLKLSLDRLDEYNLGYAFGFFETACAISGYMLGVNPFDQPGVESYKKNLFALLGKPGFEDLGRTLVERLTRT